MHLAMWPTPCTTGQVHLLVYYIKLKSRLSALFWRSVSRPWLHGSTSDLLDAMAMSSGVRSLFLKVSKSLSFSTRVPDRHPCRSRRP